MTLSGTSDSPRTVVGRGAYLVERLADDLRRSFGGPPLAKARRVRLDSQRVGPLLKGLGKGSFEVSLVDEDGNQTGYIARVAVTYSRFDADEANRKRP